MMKFVSAAICSLLLAASALAEEATGPSFDCARASTEAETAICESPSLGWYDRQLARAWKIALKAAGKAGESSLKASQAAFLKDRDACVKSDNVYGCMSDAYLGRIGELAGAGSDGKFWAASFAGETGGADVVRYPDGKVALSISTIGGGDHTCAFETENAAIDARDVIHWSEKPDEMYDDACTITGSLSRTALTITAEGGACTYYCGVRAELSGTFPRRK